MARAGRPRACLLGGAFGQRQQSVLLRSAPIDVAPGPAPPPLRLRGRHRVHERHPGAWGRDRPLCRPHRGGSRADGRGAHRLSISSATMRVYVAADIPLPSPRGGRLALDALADYIGFCTLRVRGGSLVLFTSYTDLRAVAAALAPVYRGGGPAPAAPGRGPVAHRARPPDARAGQCDPFRHRQLLDRSRRPRRGPGAGRDHPAAVRPAGPSRSPRRRPSASASGAATPSTS